MPDATRRRILSLGLIVPYGPAVLTAKREIVAAAARNAPKPLSHLEPWDGIAFTAQCGVNLVSLGFEVYRPVTIASWEESVPTDRLSGLKSAGFDHVRIAFDPTPALAAADAAALNAVLAVAKHAIDASLRAGLKVILDLHVATVAPWSTALIEADFPDGNKWHRYLDVARAFGSLCAAYETSKLAFELYNENSNGESYGNNAWAARIHTLWKVVRSVNLKTTLLVGGSFYSSIEGLQDLTANRFDKNTGFVVHNYNPAIFTHQNAVGYTRFVERLHYPPIASDKSDAFGDMAARIDASNLPDAAKASAKLDRSKRLSAYFDTPQGPDYVAAKVQEVVRWCTRNGVEHDRIFVTEFGTHNDHDFRGAATLPRMAWVQDVDTANEEAGFARTIWNYNSPDYWDITKEDGSWRIRNGFLIALNRRPTNDYEPEAVSYFESIANELSGRTKALISETILQLKQADLWTKLDALYLFASDNPEAAVTDWKRGRKIAFDARDLRFVSRQGFVNQTQAAAVLAAGATGQETSAPGGGDSHAGLYIMGGGESDLHLRRGESVPLLNIDTSDVSAPPGLRAHGEGIAGSDMHAIVSRPRSDPAELYINGSVSARDASAIEPSGEGVRLFFGASNAASCAMLHFGHPLTAADAKTLYTIGRFYCNAIRRKTSAV